MTLLHSESLDLTCFFPHFQKNNPKITQMLQCLLDVQYTCVTESCSVNVLSPLYFIAKKPNIPKHNALNNKSLVRKQSRTEKRPF